MPLGRQLSKLFNPGPSKSYDPNREALFAELLSSGVAPTNDMGTAIGNLAKMFVGQRGLSKQGQARDIQMDQQAEMEAAEQARKDQALAEQLAEWGVNPNLPDSKVRDEAMRRSRPQEPTPEAAPDASKAVILTNPNTGETRPVFNRNDMQAAWSEGFRQPVKEPEAPRSFDKAREYRNRDGDVQWVTNEAQRTEALGGGFVPYTAPKPAAAAKPPKPPPGYRWTEDGSGNLEPIPGGPGAKVAESQQRATEAAVRVGEGLDVLQAPTENGERRFEVLAGLAENVIGSVPGGNYKLSADYQMASQSMRDIAASLLRLETGAAAKAEEQEDIILRYSPRPGDKPEVIEQKMNGLMTRFENAKHLAGPTFGLMSDNPSASSGDTSAMSNEDLLKELGL